MATAAVLSVSDKGNRNELDTTAAIRVERVHDSGFGCLKPFRLTQEITNLSNNFNVNLMILK